MQENKINHPQLVADLVLNVAELVKEDLDTYAKTIRLKTDYCNNCNDLSYIVPYYKICINCKKPI